MRTLVVDDEVINRQILFKILSCMGECDQAEGGAGAMAAVKEAWEDGSPFDVMMLDIEMPDMDGIEVLNEIRKMEAEKKIPSDKKMKIFMVTSHSDRDTVVKCIKGGCNDFITKPFDREIILVKLKRFGCVVSRHNEGAKGGDTESERSIRKIFSGVFEKLKEGDIRLPVLPRVVQAVGQTMREPGATIADLTRVIEKDASMSIKLVSVANSPVYGVGGKTNAVAKAISRLGQAETRGIVAAMSKENLFSTDNKQLTTLMEKVWSHSLACAYCAKPLAHALGSKDPDRFFLMGLVHDIGKAFLLRGLGEACQQDESFDMDDVISILEEVHSKFGKELLKRWGFGLDFVATAMEHERPEFDRTTEKGILVMNLAANMTRNIGYGFLGGEVDLLHLRSTKLLGIDADGLDRFAQEARNKMQDSGAAFQPTSPRKD